MDLKPGEFCYKIMEEQYILEGNTPRYIPSLVRKDDPCHYPMTGGPEQTPWYWGKSLEEAQEIARDYNTKTLKLTEEQIDDIIMSSIRASFNQG